MNAFIDAPQMTTLMLFALIFLAPMVPAAFFFSVLKSTAIASGPLQGFDMKFGGAFAAYFATALLAVATYPIYKPHFKPEPEVWTVEGSVLDDAGNPMALLTTNDIRVYPGPGAPMDGYFKVTVTATPSQNDYPKLSIGHEGYLGSTIDLDPDPSNAGPVKPVWDTTDKIIKLKAVKLQKQAAYAPTESPVPVTAGAR